CKRSVLHQTQLWISQGKLRAVAFATVVEVTVANEAGGTSKTDAVKVLLDHANQPGYAAYVTFQVSNGKSVPDQIIYQELPERFWGPRPPNCSTGETLEGDGTGT